MANSATYYQARKSGVITALDDRPKMSADALKQKFDDVSDDDVTTQFNAFLAAFAAGNVIIPGGGGSGGGSDSSVVIDYMATPNSTYVAGILSEVANDKVVILKVTDNDAYKYYLLTSVVYNGVNTENYVLGFTGRGSTTVMSANGGNYPYYTVYKLSYSNSAWSWQKSEQAVQSALPTFSTTPTQNSTALITSGGVFAALQNVMKKFIATYNMTTYADFVDEYESGKICFAKTTATDDFYLPLISVGTDASDDYVFVFSGVDKDGYLRVLGLNSTGWTGSTSQLTNKQDRIKYTTLTLANWATEDEFDSSVPYTCTKTVSGMTSSAIVWLTFSDTTTEFSVTQADNSLIFSVAALDVPVSDVTVNVAFCVGEALT